MKLLKSTSIIMALILVYTIFVAPVSAIETAEVVDNDATTSNYQIDPETKEVLSMRDEYTQAFLNDDGNIDVYSFTVPVNYRGANNECIAIDNTITKSVSSDFKYENAANDVKVYLDDATQAGGVAQISYKMMSISVEPLKSFKSEAKVITDKNEYKFDTGVGNLFENRTVLYNDLYSDTDYAITVTNSGMRQNIILKNADASNSYTFRVKLDKVDLADDFGMIENNGTIILTNRTNEAVYKIFAPHVKDANGNNIPATMDILSSDNTENTLTIRVSVNDEGLQNDVAYPVTVSSTYTTYRTANSPTAFWPEDLYVIPDPNGPIVRDSTDYLVINAAGTYKIYLKFEPEFVGVTAADLCLTEYDNDSQQASNRIYAWGALHLWTPVTLRHGTTPNLTEASSNVGAVGTGVYSINVANIINEQIEAEHGEDFGFVIRYVPNTWLRNGCTSFYSSDYGEMWLAPYLMRTLAN